MEDLDKRFIVTFYGREVGIVNIDENALVKWEPINHEICDLLTKSRYEKNMPACIYNIHPSQSIIGLLLGSRTKEDYYNTHFKSLSNLRFFQIDGYHTQHAFKNVAEDIDRIDGEISDFLDHQGVLNVSYDGPVGTVGLERLPFSKLKEMTSVLEHRISGNESKSFAHLSKSGKLQIASDGRSFTHFIKYGEAGGRESHPLMEWMGIELMKAVGLETADIALMKVDDQCSPALIVERFDIPRRNEVQNSEKKKLIQDFYTIFGRDPQDDNAHRTITYKQLIREFKNYTRNLEPEDQKEQIKLLLTRIVCAWAMSDDDLHSKNLSILMDIDVDNPQNSTFKMSPAYDGHINIVNGSHGASMYYKLHDKVNGGATAKIRLNDFMKMLKAPELSINSHEYCIFDTSEEVEEFIRNISSICAYKAAEMASNPPDFIKELRYGSMYLQDMKLGAATVIERAKSIKADYPKDFDYTGIFKWAKKFGPKARKDALKSERGLSIEDPNHAVNISRYRELLSPYEQECPTTRRSSPKHTLKR